MSHRRDHTFHIHTNALLITRLRGQAAVARHLRGWGGALTFRSRFLDSTGISMLHCHTMNYQELGVMQTGEVYKA
jgi:FtsP/CotA-like multicopper oxidase with cupredoxin domain